MWFLTPSTAQGVEADICEVSQDRCAIVCAFARSSAGTYQLCPELGTKPAFVGLRDARANGTRAETTSQKMRRCLALYALLLAPAAAALRRGDAAPAFVGENYDGEQVTLASATGPKGLVLWFYPKAGTGG